MTSTSCPRLGGARAWKDDEPLECVSVVPDGPDTSPSRFGPLGRLVRLPPGQFLTLELRSPAARSTAPTISSSPSRPLSITLTVKAAGASVGTRWMLDNLRPGMRIKAIGPGGIFVPEFRSTASSSDLGRLRRNADDVDDHLPLRSRRRPRHLLRAVRQAAVELVFRRSLEHMASRVPTINSTTWWGGRPLRLDRLSRQLQPADARPDGARLLEREVYCCGRSRSCSRSATC